MEYYVTHYLYMECADTWTHTQDATHTQSLTRRTCIHNIKTQRYDTRTHAYTHILTTNMEHTKFFDDNCQRTNKELFSGSFQIRVNEHCEPSKYLLHLLKHYAAAEKEFQDKFGHDVICRKDGMIVRSCRLCVKYSDVVKVVRVHMKKCLNCSLQEKLLSSGYDCLQSMAVDEVPKSDEGYVINYMGIEGDYLEHWYKSIMLPSCEEFKIN